MQTSTFDVTVTDTEKPVLAAHANVSANNDPGVCSAVVSFTPPTATDNCPGIGTVTCSPASGSTFPVGTTTVTCTVTDAHGNTQTSTFDVTVTDTEKPVLAAHANVSASNDLGVCSAVVSFTPPTATDNCPGIGTVTCSPASGSTFPVGTTTVTCTVTDAHGNTQTSTFDVTVNDTEKPVLAAHANVTANNDPGLCAAVVSFTPPTATDNCPGIGTVTCSPGSGSTFPVGTTTVTCTVTDAHGNTQTSTFDVTVTDTEKPVLAAHANVTVSNNAGLCSAVVTFTPPTATDNCPGVGTVTCIPASGSTFPVGTTTVTCTVTDAHGNTQTSTFDVTVNDTEKPVLAAHANVAVNNNPGLCAAVVSFTPPTATDNCPGVGTVTCSPGSGSTFPVGTTTVTCTVTDAHGNAQTSTFDVTVTDTEKPVLAAHANVTVGNDPGLCSAVVTFTPPTATDNCPGVGSVSCSPGSGSTFPVGTTTVTCTVTDAHGNTQTSAFDVIVNDTEKPVLSAHVNVTVSNDPGLCSAVVTFTPSTATDNCPGVGTVSCSPASGSTFPVGTTTVTCTVTDAHGNTQTSTFDVIVSDTEKPVISTANITKSNDSGQCGATVAHGTTATDNCGLQSLTGVRNDGTALNQPYPVGTTTITWTALDGHGNSASATQTITVNDAEKPVISSPASVTKVYDPAICGATVDYAAVVTVADNCPGATFSCVPPAGTVFPFGSTTVTCTATDAHGNSATRTFTVVVGPATTVATVTVSPGPQQYTDKITFTATLSLSSSCGPQPADSVSFKVGTQLMGKAKLLPATGGGLIGTLTVPLLGPEPTASPGTPTGQIAPGTHGVTADFIGVSARYTVASATASLTVTREDARTTYIGALFVSTANATSSQATILLSATIQDITATPDASGDSDFGDIRNASVTFVNRDLNADIATVPVSLVSPGDTKTGTATYNWNVDIGSSDAKQYTIGVRVNRYYTRDNSSDNTVVCVAKPLASGFITGGGYLVTSTSAGVHPGTAGLKNNFGFNVKFNKSGTNLQGNINTIIRSGGRVYQVKGNSMTSLAVSPTLPIATFNGKASLTDITDPSNPLGLDGNATLQVMMTDSGEPGVNDSLAIMVWDKTGALWFSSRWTGTQTAKQVLGGGNIQVRNGATSSPSASAALSGGTETGAAITNDIPVAYALSHAAPNPFVGRTSFRLDLPEPSRVTMAIYDVQGRRVVSLIHGAMEPGRYDHAWSGRDDSGRPAARGVYFLGVDAISLSGGKTFTVRKKLILLR